MVQPITNHLIGTLCFFFAHYEALSSDFSWWTMAAMANPVILRILVLKRSSFRIGKWNIIPGDQNTSLPQGLKDSPKHLRKLRFFLTNPLRPTKSEVCSGPRWYQPNCVGKFCCCKTSPTYPWKISRTPFTNSFCGNFFRIVGRVSLTS